METKALQADIKNGQLKRVYLLYGDERYLVSYYANALGEGCDKDVFDGNAPPAEIILAAEAFPFLAEKRAVYIRESKLFAPSKKDEGNATGKSNAETLANFLPNIPEDTILIFIETDVDKRVRLYKKVAEIGRAVDCAPLAAPDLSRWVMKKFREKGKTVAPAVAEQLMRFSAHNMTALVTEIDKLIAYAGQRPSIEAADINELCTPTLQTRVFDLLAAMGKGNTGNALTLYSNMLHMKESPFMILAMLIRQFRILLQCKCANDKKIPRASMAGEFGLRPFMIDEALSQAKRYTTERLVNALADCQDTDLRIKTGRVDAELGVEMLIVSYTL
ncbi:MAG: DNA polymerase III subunit delta [Defluviitaleaceae bacterium]|nr:DNA polymerase III subunit delta [Defluviitaleaceae bacterium]MCL2274355.1 DNA polymerase III subunit delta [Defluviitaleaceae bacterium]